MDSYYLKCTSHSLQSIIEHAAFTTHNDPVRHWANDHVDGPINTQIILDTIQAFNKKKSEFYAHEHSFKPTNFIEFDVHKWHFEPSNFIEIITMLNNMNVINLKIEKVYDTAVNSFEFSVILKKTN